MEPHYREIKLFRKPQAIFPLAVPSLLKESVLLLVAALIYRNATHALTKALSLFVLTRALSQAVSQVLFPKPLLFINEEGVNYAPSVSFVNLDIKLSWEEIASMSVGILTLAKTPSGQEEKAVRQTFADQPTGRRTRFLCIVPKDVEAFKRSRRLPDLEAFKQSRNLLQFDMSRALLLYFLQKTGSPVLLEQSTLPITFEDLFERVRILFPDKLEANGIKMLGEHEISIVDNPETNSAPSPDSPDQ